MRSTRWPSAIAHQQITGLVARKIFDRLVRVARGSVSRRLQQLAAAAPEQSARRRPLVREDRALQDLAAQDLDGVVPTTQTLAALDDDDVIERCSQVRGIGRWTARCC